MTDLRAEFPRSVVRFRQTGLIDFAKALAGHGVELVSTGAPPRRSPPPGWVKDISGLTGFPEMMDGRVKTLHPGAWRAARDPRQQGQARR